MTNNSELKKTSSKKSSSRFKLPSEIERWAFSNDSAANEPFKLGGNNENEYDDDDEIDDSYLQKYDDPNEKKKVIDKNEQKKRVIDILKQVKSRKLARTADITKKRNSFNSLLSNIITANSNFDLTKQEQSLSMLKINDPAGIQNSEEVLEYDDVEEEEEDDDDEQDKKGSKKKLRDESKKFRSVSSGISRAVPGSLQQNITIERNFFKDLLKLSKQRYISKINADFQKKRFLIKQTNKGLCGEKETGANFQSRSHSSVLARKSSHILAVQEPIKHTTREIKSISAFAKRRSDSITESYLKLDSNENMLNSKSVKILNSNEITYNNNKNNNNKNNNNNNNNNLRSNLKRPNTTLALSHQLNSSRSIHYSNEVKYILNDNNEKKNNADNNLFMISKPTNDQRFKSLISSMSNYKPRNDQEMTNMQPDILVKKLINSNTALQKQQGSSTAPKELSDSKRTALMEFNMKLFEKIVSNIN